MTIPNETIVDRVVQRLKTQPLGDLITEEDLHDIVKQAIPKTFFEEQVVLPTDRWGSPQKKEPMIVEIMRQLLRSDAEKALLKWKEENAELLAEHWKKVLEVGMLSYVQQLQDAKAVEHIREVLKPWFASMNEERSRRGENPIYF
jgi:hypothetical protein